MSIISILGTVASLVGLSISIYLLKKVGNLERAKSQEREFMKRILHIDQLDQILGELERELREGRGFGRSKAIGYLSSISAVRNRVKGALDVLGDIYESGQHTYPIIPSGYYSNEFLHAELAKATNLIRIVCYRNIRLASYGVLEMFTKKLVSGCCIEVAFLSPKASDVVLDQMAKKLPYPTNMSIEMMREDLEQKKNFILQFIEQNVNENDRMNFKCRIYSVFPRFHMVQVDDRIYIAVPNYRSQLLMDRGEKIVPCIVASARSTIGRYIEANFEYLFTELSEECTFSNHSGHR